VDKLETYTHAQAGHYAWKERLATEKVTNKSEGSKTKRGEDLVRSGKVD